MESRWAHGPGAAKTINDINDITRTVQEQYDLKYPTYYLCKPVIINAGIYIFMVPGMEPGNPPIPGMYFNAKVFLKEGRSKRSLS